MASSCSSGLFTGDIVAFDIGNSKSQVRIAGVINGKLSDSRHHFSRLVSSSLFYNTENGGSFVDLIEESETPKKYEFPTFKKTFNIV